MAPTSKEAKSKEFPGTVQQSLYFVPLGHVAMSRKMFCCHNWDDAAEHPTMHGIPPTTESYKSPNVNNAEVEKPCLREKSGRGKAEVDHTSYLTTKARYFYMPLLNLQSVCSYTLAIHLHSSPEWWVLLSYLINVVETRAHKFTWAHVYEERIRILTQFCCLTSSPCFIKPWLFIMSFPPGCRSIFNYWFGDSV